jgi:sulfatase modifying factor 1
MRALLLLTLLAAAPTRAGEGWPDIDTPLRTGADASSDAAVVIGNEDYDDIADVPYAGADAAAFRSFLLYTRGVPLSNLQMLSDASPKQMERAVEKAAAQVGKGGVLWVYYAGHGAAHPVTKERVLLGENAILDPDPEIFEEGAVELEVLKRAAASAQGQAVFVVDACYSGTGRGGDALGDGRFAVPPSYDAGSSVIEWTATQPKQVASPLHATGHGAFTYFAVGALRGWADGELGRRDGAVTLEEAQAYVSTALLEVGQRDQTPAVVGEDALALVDSRGLESAPDLRSLSVGGAPAALPTSGELSSSGGFVADLDVSAALAEKACADDAERKASTQRSSRVSSEAQSLAREASSAWSRLGSQAEACLGLELAERTPCITAVKEYIRWADALEVSLSEGFEQVTTDCGERSVPMAAQRKSVPVSELEQARAVLARLESASSTSGDPSGASAGKYGYEMVQVPGGRFTMGQGGTQADEKPAHSVSISGFWMGKTEVTQGLYQQVMGKNPSNFSSCGDSCPVETVSWLDAVTFANKLSELEGLEACYTISGSNVSWPRGRSCTGYRLPTEAEWEYAARAGQSTTYAGSNELGDVAWYGDNSGSKTHPVAQKDDNAWGLYDMSGNVWEWVWDWYDSDYYQSSSSTDPVGPSTGSNRVRRGGSWGGSPSLARVAYRSYVAPSSRYGDLGLRLARSNP